MNGKPGVLEVIDAEIASLPIMAEMMTGHDGDAFDAAEAVRRMTEARATAERLLKTAEATVRHFKGRGRNMDDAMMILALADAADAFRGEA